MNGPYPAEVGFNQIFETMLAFSTYILQLCTRNFPGYQMKQARSLSSPTCLSSDY